MLMKLSKSIDRLTHWLGRTVGWLTLAMVLLMATIVVLRYGFAIGSIAVQEAVMYLNAAIVSVGAAYTLKEQGHVRVDIFYSALSAKKAACIDLLGGVLFLLPSMLFIFFSSWDYVSLSWRIREGSAEVSGLPFIYLLKTALLILSGLLALQGVSEIIKSGQRLVGSRAA